MVVQVVRSIYMNFQPHTRNFESYLEQILPKVQESNDLAAAMRYCILGGGKRLRPGLVYATGDMLEISAEHLHAAAAAVELVHTYSLIHDDLPSMDNDDLRRGKPTCHKAFSESTAILAGDALLTLAFEVLSDAELNPIPAEQRILQVQTLSKASGAVGLVLGQAEDIAAEESQIDLEPLSAIHHKKTGALFKACVNLALYASENYADVHKQQQLSRYAENLGLLFQIQDDILDVSGDQEQIGKPVGSDQELGKSTYPSILGLDVAKQHAKEALKLAVDALRDFGTAADNLRQVANFALSRSS